MALGRDFLRLLRCIPHDEQINRLWTDLISHPSRLSDTYTGLDMFWSVPTLPELHIASIPPDIEMSIVFILHNVPRRLAYTYIERLKSRCLDTRESIIVDLIRFICTIVHPPNKVLASSTVQRHECILILLKGCKYPQVVQQAKLAVYYDWFSYIPEAPSIMDLEPGVLMITRCARKEPKITASLIEFLRLCSNLLAPSLSSRIVWHIRVAMHACLEIGVVKFVIFKCRRREVFVVPDKAREAFQELFGVFGDQAAPLIPIDAIPRPIVNVEQSTVQIAQGQAINSGRPRRDLRIVLAEYGLAIEDGDTSSIAALTAEWIACTDYTLALSTDAPPPDTAYIVSSVADNINEGTSDVQAHARDLVADLMIQAADGATLMHFHMLVDIYTGLYREKKEMGPTLVRTLLRHFKHGSMLAARPFLNAFLDASATELDDHMKV